MATKHLTNSPLAKTLLLFGVTLSVIVISLFFAIGHHDDLDNRVQYSLIDHRGQTVSQKHFAGRYQLVFFGFTSCQMVCPTQMHKLTRVMFALDQSNTGHKVYPQFITVDPERDTPEKISNYLEHFHERIVGLTGSRQSLSATADSFKTLLAEAPNQPEPGYQIQHSSLIYIVDPFSRVVDYLNFETDVNSMVDKIQSYLQ